MFFRRILIALDYSAIAAHAMEVGTELANALKAQVGLVYAVDPAQAFQANGGLPPEELVANLKREGESFLASAAARIVEAPAWRFLRVGKPADEILAAARDWEADVIVIGTHGRSGVSRLMLGSTAEWVVRHSPCPVLVVRPHP